MNKILNVLQTGLPSMITVKDDGELVYIEWSWATAPKRWQSSRNVEVSGKATKRSQGRTFQAKKTAEVETLW